MVECLLGLKHEHGDVEVTTGITGHAFYVGVASKPWFDPETKKVEITA